MTVTVQLTVVTTVTVQLKLFLTVFSQKIVLIMFVIYSFGRALHGIALFLTCFTACALLLTKTFYNQVFSCCRNWYLSIEVKVSKPS